MSSSRYQPFYGVKQGRKMFQQYWALLDLPRHLSFFGREGLSDLCDKAGMKLIAFKTPLLETAWCYFASVSNYANHCKRTPCGERLVWCRWRCYRFYRSALYGGTGMAGPRNRSFRCRRQEIGIETASLSGYAYLQR